MQDIRAERKCVVSQKNPKLIITGLQAEFNKDFLSHVTITVTSQYCTASSIGKITQKAITLPVCVPAPERGIWLSTVHFLTTA